MADDGKDQDRQTGNSSIGSTGTRQEGERPDLRSNTPPSAGDEPSPASAPSTDTAGNMGSTGRLGSPGGGDGQAGSDDAGH